MPSESHSSATEAFNALRAEVTAVHTQLLVVAARAVPDYDLTLGEFARRLGQVENSLKHLSLCLPPAMLRGESEMTLSMREAADAMHARTAELIAATGSATTKQVVRRQVAGAGVLGIVAGLLLCAVLVVLLPRQAGAWMTADLLGGDPWTAGLAQ